MAKIDFKLAIALQQADEIVLRFASGIGGSPNNVALEPDEKDFIARTVAEAVKAVPKDESE